MNPVCTRYTVKADSSETKERWQIKNLYVIGKLDNIQKWQTWIINIILATEF